MCRHIPARLSLLLWLAGALSLAGCCRSEDSAAGLDAIRAEAIAAHTRFLADDALEGRGTATRGMALAANYAAAHFETLGLEPSGDNNSYFQRVGFRKVTLEAEGSALSLVRGGRDQRLRFGHDFVMRGHPQHTTTEVSAPLVFAGYGVTAPEQGYDDYAGIDAAGKIVVLLSGAPDSFSSTVRAHYSSNSVKLENAVAHGATGVITVWTNKDEERFPWPRIRRFASRPSLHWRDAEGRMSGAYPSIQGMAIVNHAAAERLLAGAPMSLQGVLAAAAEGKMRGFELPSQARMRMRSRHEPVECANVVAVLRGSDPRLREEYVVFTAHLDHEGIGAPLGDDAIYNGALDNASGSAVLFEIARAFASLPEPPRRSVLFIATTGEEEGLLGADYFAQHPTVPLQSIVANVNLDAIPALIATKDFVALGAEHSSLGLLAEAAARELGLEISPDSAPEQNFFIRSDQYPFVKQGVPALFLIPGSKAAEPGVDAAARFQRYLTTVYHTPKDDMSQALDFEAAATAAKINFLIGYRVAEAGERPQWNSGDFFGAKFSRR